MADALDAAAIILAAMVLANTNVVNANITGERMNTSQINFYKKLLTDLVDRQFKQARFCKKRPELKNSEVSINKLKR